MAHFSHLKVFPQSTVVYFLFLKEGRFVFRKVYYR